MHYRRAQIPGATDVFTVNLAYRKLSLLVDNIELLKEAIRHVKMTHPCEIVAMVVLPDGRASTQDFLGVCPRTNESQKIANRKASAAIGNDGIGNIRYAMTMIWRATSITFVTTQ